MGKVLYENGAWPVYKTETLKEMKQQWILRPLILSAVPDRELMRLVAKVSLWSSPAALVRAWAKTPLCVLKCSAISWAAALRWQAWVTWSVSWAFKWSMVVWAISSPFVKSCKSRINQKYYCFMWMEFLHSRQHTCSQSPIAVLRNKYIVHM